MTNQQRTIHLDPDDVAWQRAAQDATLRPTTVAVAIVQHPLTRHYQIALSLYGTDLTSLAAFRTAAAAQPWYAMLMERLARWQGDEPTTGIPAFVREAEQASGLKPEPLPDDLVNQVLAQIGQV